MTFDTTGLTEKRNRRGTTYYENAEGDITAKVCTKCLTLQQLRDFNKSKTGLGKRRSVCKKCRAEKRVDNSQYYKEYRKKYYINNKERIDRRNKEWAVNNKERLREYYKKYRSENKDRIRVYRKEYYLENKEEISQKSRIRNRENSAINVERVRQWRLNNPNKYREQMREYREKNGHRLREYSREHYEANKDRYAENRRRWAAENRDEYLLHFRQRRARVKELPDTMSPEEQDKLKRQFNHKCSLSESDKEIHLDHVIPVSIGHGGTIYENMIPLRADLNISKSNRNIFDWFEDNRDRFGLEQRKFDELIEYLAEINEMTSTEYEEYVRWCHDNPRTVKEIEADNERYGYMKPSSEIWREEVANNGRELVEA